MAVFNYQKKEIDAKIVYYGPGISGKTTNLQYIHQHLKAEQRGKMVSLATDEERTLFFDFLPIELESVRGFRTRFHLYTVPGQVYYGATRRAVLTGADGIIFVADSQRDRLEDNLISFKDLEENLHYYGKKIETVPLIVQYNKRDLPNVLPVEELNSKINRLNVPYYESVAILGKGVFETLTMMCRMVLKTIEDGTETKKSPVQSISAAQSQPTPNPAIGKRSSPGIPIPKPSPAPPTGGLRLERTETAPEPPAREFTRPAARRTSVEKPPSVRGPIGAEVGPMGKRMAMETAHRESVHMPKIGQMVSVERDEDRKKGNGKSFLSRMFEKKKTDEFERIEEKVPGNLEESKDKLRISSCGQPRITGATSVEIPLILEVSTNGQGESLSLNLNLAINLDQLQSRG
jgi:signal recognition particle receptor subunit beta